MVETRRLKALRESAGARLALPDRFLIVALSGGADSAALAYLCARQVPNVRALHVNHGLRHSAVLESAARSIAQDLELSLTIETVDVPDGPSPEGQARRARYEAFGDGLGPNEVVLTAHTQDDNAETVLLNAIRGTGLRGLRGIPYHRTPSVYRPILEVRRAETRELANLVGLGFVDDPMNEDLSLTRNWIRRVIIPQLEQANPRLVESLSRTSWLVEREAALVDEVSREVVPTLGEGAAKVARSVLLAAPESVADRVIIGMLAHVIGDSAVTAERVGRLRSVLKGHSDRQQVGGGAIAETSGAMLIVSGTVDDDEPADIELSPGHHRTGRLEFEVLSLDEPCRVLPLSRWAAVFPAGTRLVARSDGFVTADGEEAWIPGEKRLPVAWYEPGTVGYLSVVAREGTGWTSSR